MYEYLHGDRRFGKVKRNKRDIVFAWAKKEFSNLLLINKVGVSCPMPIAFFENVLVMEFIGTDEIASSSLKDNPLENVEETYKIEIDFLVFVLIFNLILIF